MRIVRPLALLICFGALSALGMADAVLTVRVDVTDPPQVKDPRIPVVGDYTFTVGKNGATVLSPNGKTFLLDFERHTFTSLDPVRKTFYEVGIADVLANGTRLPLSLEGSYSVKGSISFTPIGQSGREILNRPANPYNMTLEAALNRQDASAGIGLRGAYTPGGGLVFAGGSPVARRQPGGKGVRINGQLWMVSPMAGVDREGLNTAIECVLLWDAPEMKELSERVHKTNLAILGADFTVGTYGGKDTSMMRSPIVSIKVTALGPGTLDASSLTVPAGYQKSDPPSPPMGS